jgi:hypothetical protein
MNHADLAPRIQSLEGLTPEEKAALLGLLHEKKKYGLVWEDKPEAVEQQLLDHLPVLTEVPERYVASGTPPVARPAGVPPRVPAEAQLSLGLSADAQSEQAASLGD